MKSREIVLYTMVGVGAVVDTPYNNSMLDLTRFFRREYNKNRKVVNEKTSAENLLTLKTIICHLKNKMRVQADYFRTMSDDANIKEEELTKIYSGDKQIKISIEPTLDQFLTPERIEITLEKYGEVGIHSITGNSYMVRAIAVVKTLNSCLLRDDFRNVLDSIRRDAVRIKPENKRNYHNSKGIVQ